METPRFGFFASWQVQSSYPIFRDFISGIPFALFLFSFFLSSFSLPTGASQALHTSPPTSLPKLQYHVIVQNGGVVQ